MHDVCTDAEMIALLENARKGDPDAYDRLYNLYADGVFRYLYARLGQREIAEDLTADVFVRLIRSMPQFKVNAARPVAAFSAWLYRIAGNILTDEYRKHKYRRHYDISEHPNLADANADPHAHSAAHDDRDRLSSAITQLGAEQQTVLVYRFVQDYSVLEVAELMGKTAGAVKALQHRAVANLRRILGGAVE